MKILIIFGFLFLNILSLKAQSDTTGRKEYSEILQNDDYGNPDKTSSRKAYELWQYQLATTIVIIGDSIYTLSSEEYRKKKQSGEIPVIIKDEKSASKIKTVIIYKSKN